MIKVIQYNRIFLYRSGILTLTNLIIINWLLSVGFIPVSSLEVEENTLFRYDNSFIQAFGVDFTFAETVNLYTSIKIRETKAHGVFFDPYRTDFTFGAEVWHKGFRLGASHECDHDIITDNFFNDYNGLDGAWTDIYLGWTNHFKISDNISLAPVAYIGYRPVDHVYIRPVTDTENYFGTKFIHGNYHNTIYGRTGVSIEMFKYYYAEFLFQPEYSIEKNEWSSVRGHIVTEGRYRNIALGIDWKMQKRFHHIAYAMNDFMIYVSFKGKTSLL